MNRLATIHFVTDRRIDDIIVSVACDRRKRPSSYYIRRLRSLQ